MGILLHKLVIEDKPPVIKMESGQFELAALRSYIACCIEIACIFARSRRLQRQGLAFVTLYQSSESFVQLTCLACLLIVKVSYFCTP
jgi:hypothetical protein